MPLRTVSIGLVLSSALLCISGVTSGAPPTMGPQMSPRPKTIEGVRRGTDQTAPSRCPNGYYASPDLHSADLILCKVDLKHVVAHCPTPGDYACGRGGGECCRNGADNSCFAGGFACSASASGPRDACCIRP